MTGQSPPSVPPDPGGQHGWAKSHAATATGIQPIHGKPGTIDRKYFRQGTGAERIQVRGPAGRAAQLAYTLPPAPVIQELNVRATLFSNRAGIQLAATVVLPRSTDRSTGRPFELLVRGVQIGSGGNWEEVTLENLPQLLANHARVARVQYGAALDGAKPMFRKSFFSCRAARGQPS